jgi:hypothetical protein
MMLRIPLVTSCLLLALAGHAAWGEEPAETKAPGPPPSNIEGWHEEDDADSWTWFGMSYELRKSVLSAPKGIASSIPIKRANSKK